MSQPSNPEIPKSAKRMAEICKDYFTQKRESTYLEHQKNLSRGRELKEMLENPALSEEQKGKIFAEAKEEENRRLRDMRRKMYLSDFEVLKIIGRGAFGEVRLVKYKTTGEVFAMKIMLKQHLKKKDQEKSIRAERDVLTMLDKRWIVDLYYTFQDDERLYMIMEFCSGGDLMGLLIKKDIFSESAAKFYTAEMIMGISSLHRKGYIHRDLKPDNFLITSRGHLKLTDMGMCIRLEKKYSIPDKNDLTRGNNSLPSQPHHIKGKATHRSREMAYSQVGTPDYVAPEVIMQVGYKFEADWWSMGVILYEMLAGYTPFYDDYQDHIYQRICGWQQYLTFPQEMLARTSPECIDFIRRLITGAKHRLGANGMKEIIEHPWLRDVDWKNLINQEAPYPPSEDCDLDEVCKLIQTTPTHAPNFQRLVSQFCQSFDQFDDVPLENYNRSIRAGSGRSGNGGNAFIGYTFKRDKIRRYMNFGEGGEG